MKSVAVDLCNTVCDVNDCIEQMLHLKRESGKYKIEGVSPDYFRTNPEFFENPIAYRYAAEVLHLLSKKYQIVYLTARPMESCLATEHFLRKNNFPIGKIVHSTNKVEDFKKLDLYYAFDDSPEEILSYQRAGIPVLIKKWDYNEHLKGVFFEWEELYASLLKGEDIFRMNKAVSK